MGDTLEESEQNRGRLGGRIETALVASLVAMLGVQGQRFLSTGEVPERTGNTHPVIAPYGTFNASDGPMNIASATERMWRALCVELGLPRLPEDPRFANNAQRVVHRALVQAMVDEQIGQKRRAEWPRPFPMSSTWILRRAHCDVQGAAARGCHRYTVRLVDVFRSILAIAGKFGSGPSTSTRSSLATPGSTPIGPACRIIGTRAEIGRGVA